jgi:sugar phosphate isomerase/epimerase
MKVGGAELTYCTNIHPGETFAEVFDNVKRHVPRVRKQVAGKQPFGVGLRLSAEATHTLSTPSAFEEFKEFLDREALYVFTVNGFPYGRFHGQPVKAMVYDPDWTTRERVDYTLELCNVLARLIPEGSMGSISTVPGGFKPHFGSTSDRRPVVSHLLEVAAALHRIEQDLGAHLVLALEPEPHCLLETTNEAVRFFEDDLLATDARTEMAARAGLSDADCEVIIRRHLGVCLDTCHAAVEFEDPDETVDELQRAGICIAKVQLSAGLRLPTLSPEALTQLGTFDERVYLHQVVARTSAGELLRFEDLPRAFASEAARRAEEWRVHFHVPLYTESLGSFFNTQPYLTRILKRHAKAPISGQLEVETYTWDVLPERHRRDDVVDSIARELDWVVGKLL